MMKRLASLILLLLVSCAVSADNEINSREAENFESQMTPGNPTLPIISQAPELENDVWLNTETPLRLSELKGQVVLLEMWTFG